ncbi:gamma-glutamylcyclotransferase family protein [Mucilaginibacter ginsenosidivorax]|nr:gamma-glutamylcyclotransferase family protein [Mucilaginibacter ginsenosidivorax]
MITINQYLFVYGTLLEQGNTYAQYLQQHCTLIGGGKFGGILYDVGHYPGATIDAITGRYVYGSIYLMDDAEKILPVIDEYEGIGAQEAKPHEYTRQLIEIDTEQGPVVCWVYIYNWPTDNLPEVPGGDYIRYIGPKKQ